MEEKTMFCKNCGYEMDPNAAVCIKCGCAKGNGSAYCYNCGSPIAPGAVVCTRCGAAAARPAGSEGKSKLVAGLMGIFFGSLGVHNFILGYNGKAVGQLLLTLLSCGLLSPISAIWGLIEGILILAGSISKDANGDPLAD